MDKKPPILMFCDDKKEITSIKLFAQQFPSMFKKKDEIKAEGIHRCYMIFHDHPESNSFLNGLEIVYRYHAASCWTNVYRYRDALIAIAQEGGAAAVGMMEELSVFGIDEFVAIGSAGCLDDKVKDKFVLVTSAIRDEGASYHYLKPDAFCDTSKPLNKELAANLDKLGLEYVEGISWTNDAFYRETESKLKYVKSLGAVAVEMECASWCACAKFRKFKFGQILFFGDIVSQSGWERIVKSETQLTNKRDVVVQIVKKFVDMNYEF